jgi:hypothetical protein
MIERHVNFPEGSGATPPAPEPDFWMPASPFVVSRMTSFEQVEQTAFSDEGQQSARFGQRLVKGGRKSGRRT